MSSSTLNYLILGAAALGVAFIIRDGIIRSSQTQGDAKAASVIEQVEPSPRSTTSIYEEIYPGQNAASLRKASDGHYWAEAVVNGRSFVDFMVDTGASTCVLTHADAEKLGISWKTLPRNVRITTAGGTVFAAEVLLEDVTISRVTVKNVRAVILERDIEQSLLGMSFLEQVSEVRTSGNRLLMFQ